MDWLRLRNRAVESSLITERPTDARRADDPPRGAEPDPELERSRRLRRRVWVFMLYTFFLSGCVGALFGSGGLLDLLRLHGELRAVRGEVAEEQRAVDELRWTVGQLQGDSLARERIAREELGLARPGEVVFVLPWDETETGPDGRPPHAPAPVPEAP